MRILLLDDNKINKLSLPDKFEGFFAVRDDNNNIVLNVEGTNQGWKISQNPDTSIYKDGNYIPETIINPYDSYDLMYINDPLIIYAEKSIDDSFNYYSVSNNMSIIISNNSNSTIRYCNNRFNSTIQLSFVNNEWSLKTDKPGDIYINGYKLRNEELHLNFGDSLFIYGLRINLFNGIISTNNPLNQVVINNTLVPAQLKIYSAPSEIPASDAIKEVNIYSDNDYFYKTPRVRRFVEHYDLEIAPPPTPFKPAETSVIITLGPSITMGIASVITAYMSFYNIFSRGQSISENIPQILITILGLVSSLVWPIVTRKYNNKLNLKKEHDRQLKYNAYLKRKSVILQNVQNEQKGILIENLITPKDCETMILSKSRTLWERSADQKDFLTVRVGSGNVNLDMSGGISEEEFSLESDELKDKVIKMIDSYKVIENCPVGYSFKNKNITAIMCGVKFAKPFIENVLIQIASFHSYDDVKFVFMVSKQNMEIWSKFKEFPHVFSNDKQVRFFACTQDDYLYLDSYLNNEIIERKNNSDLSVKSEDSTNGSNESNIRLPYYLIITDNYPALRKLKSINEILNNKKNYSMSIICLENHLNRLPGQCENFLLVDSSSSILCTNINNHNSINFNVELDNSIDIAKCSKVLGNIPIEFDLTNKNLPETLGFLEMFNISRIEQLNTFNRWQVNDPVSSLKTQIGIDDEGHPIYLDLHEKFHGPHGLIAGTTGSGKSEFIITYILSLVVNYSPNEVAFILIDYKGGGLAGAFENKNLGLKLPHLAGTITNLDKASLNRTLVSITSELERRQKRFNQVREELGESTIDIYKYQRLFREGKIKEPMPHLFIISDEFAELKSQQPDFMDDLISTARIGRSLGIHLILATQKPSGVVNDQIWSNSKFKVCLKVQDASDSHEMLKKPDAATITNAGRFYLQVGNDEIYLLGQSGWSGTKYTGTNSIKRSFDRSVNFIDDVGKVIKNDDGIDRTVKVDTSKGDELSNVLKYVCEIAQKENLRTEDLWLPEIPANIFVEDLIKKYNYANNSLTAVIGEYDAPANQKQGLLTVEFDNTGNTCIYGITSSNREMLLGTMIYSLCMNSSPEELNIYIADFGSETFRMYSKFPQVGDIVYVNEADKFKKLIEIMFETVNERKVLFNDYNGDYKLYNRKNEKKVPVIMFIINNYDSLKENYYSVEEELITLSRDCERYGVMLVIATSTDSSVHSKVRRNIHNILALDLKDRMDYVEIFGRFGNIYPASYSGRGMVHLDEVYEFQTAQVAVVDDLLDFLKEKIQIQNQKYTTRAPIIPILPDIITNDLFDPYITDIMKLPIGMFKKSLKIAYYNFFQDSATIVSSSKISNCTEFIKTIIYDVKKLNQMVVLIDGEKNLSDLGGTVNGYVDNNFEPFILQFEKFLDEKIEGKNINLLLIISGLDKFHSEMSDKKFNGFFKGIRTFSNVKMILIDSAMNYKKFDYNDWLRQSVNNNNGIWIGPGFADQNVIMVSSIDSATRIDINNQYAWIVKDGKPNLIKIAGEEEKDEE